MSAKDVLIFAVGALTGGAIGAVAAGSAGVTREPETPEVRRPRSLWREVTFVSTWEERCGIALYTEYLISGLREIRGANYRVIRPNELGRNSKPLKLLHIQFEYGIGPPKEALRASPASVALTTMHNVTPLLGLPMDGYVDAYIVHTQAQLDALGRLTRKPIYKIPHGSKVFDPAPKDLARHMLGLPAKRRIIYMHGIGERKHYEDAIKVLRDLPDTLLVILASKPVKALSARMVERNITNARKLAKGLGVEDRVIIKGEWVEEHVIDLYASATDLFLFNYRTPTTISISASGALHRIISAGRPVVCTWDDSRMYELRDGTHCLKYRAGDLDGMRACILRLFEDRELAEWVGSNCRAYAYETSWANVAIQHVRVYDELWDKAVSHEVG